MTREDAIFYIKELQKTYASMDKKVAEAVDMAIEALKAKTDGDLISRQDAIDALAKEMPSLTTPDGSGEFDHDIQITDEAFVDCMQIINELQSAEPKTGRWIWDDKGYFYCGRCGKKPDDQTRTTDYCPNCGADMRGEK